MIGRIGIRFHEEKSDPNPAKCYGTEVGSFTVTVIFSLHPKGKVGFISRSDGKIHRPESRVYNSAVDVELEEETFFFHLRSGWNELSKNNDCEAGFPRGSCLDLTASVEGGILSRYLPLGPQSLGKAV